MSRFLTLFILFSLATTPAMSRAADRFDGLDAYVRDAMKTWQIPGLAIAVVKDGEIVLARGFGTCEIGKNRPVTKDTAFSIASCAKTIVGASIGILVDEGKLKWDDPVVKLLPEFELTDPYLTKHLTLRDLLTHRTGLQRCDLLGDRSDFDAAEILKRLKHIPVVAELRTRSTYSNPMFTVLTEIVARVSGQSFDQFVTDRFFGPLQMKSTTFDSRKLAVDRVAPRHWRSDDGIVARPWSKTDGIHSTVVDMARWLKLHLSFGKFGDRQILKRDTIGDMHALQFSIPITARAKDNIYAAQFYGSGLGWFVQEYRGRKIVLHGGGWGAMIAMMPEEQLGVVVLSNLDLESLPGLLMYDVFDAYLVGPETAWNRTKWESTFLRHEPPGYAYRPRDEAKKRLEKLRRSDLKPTLALERYAGRFDSKLYGSLAVDVVDDQLVLQFGEHKTKLSHRQADSFYARAPTRLTFDWLVTFQINDGRVVSVTFKHVGWDSEEKDHVFDIAVK